MFIIDTCLSHRPHSGWSSTLWKRANFGLKTLMFRRPFSTQSIKKYQKVPSARLGDNHETKSRARFTANSNKIVNQQMPHLVWWTAPKVQRSKFRKPASSLASCFFPLPVWFSFTILTTILFVAAAPSKDMAESFCSLSMLKTWLFNVL